jgi:hypothetical protein
LFTNFSEKTLPLAPAERCRDVTRDFASIERDDVYLTSGSPTIHSECAGREGDEFLELSLFVGQQLLPFFMTEARQLTCLALDKYSAQYIIPRAMVFACICS